MTGIGVDIVDLARFRRARRFERLCEYILTKAERQSLDASSDPVQFVASRFAVKEAVIKAFPEPLTLRDIEIIKHGNVPVAVVRHPSSAAYQTLVSISHATEYAVGMACVSRI